LQALYYGLGLNPAYAGLAESAVCHDSCLVSGHRNGIGPHRFHCNTKKSYSGLLAGGEQNVQLPGVGASGNLPPQLYKPIGISSARRKDDHQLIAVFFPFKDPSDHRIDSIGICNRRSPILLHNKSHLF